MKSKMLNKVKLINLECANCGKKQKIKELFKENLDPKKINKQTFSARRTPDRIHYRFVKCFRCGLIFSNPILESDKIIDLYFESDFKYTIESEYLKKTYGYYLKENLPKKYQHLKLLDVGCGNGFFLEEVKDFGIKKVYGIEPGKPTVEKARADIQKNIKIDILRTGVFGNSSFDIITCFHTLDHIVNPNEFLINTRKLLKRGGQAIFIVHNTDGLSVKLFGEKSAIFDIEHIYLFNPKSLRKIFTNNGFRVVKVFDVKNRYPLKYWTRMVPIPKFIKSPLLSFYELTGIGNLPISIKPGNIGIVAKKI